MLLTANERGWLAKYLRRMAKFLQQKVDFFSRWQFGAPRRQDFSYYMIFPSPAVKEFPGSVLVAAVRVVGQMTCSGVARNAASLASCSCQQEGVRFESPITA